MGCGVAAAMMDAEPFDHAFSTGADGVVDDALGAVAGAAGEELAEPFTPAQPWLSPQDPESSPVVAPLLGFAARLCCVCCCVRC